MAQRRDRAGGELRHHLGQVAERRLARQQRVVGRVGEQRQREAQPVGPRTPAPARRGDLTDLAGPDAEPRRVEAAAQRQLDRSVAVPAEVGDGAVGAEQVERELEPGDGAAGVDDEVEVAGRVARAARSRPRAPPPAAARGARRRPGSRRRRARRPAAGPRSSRPCRRRRRRPGRRPAGAASQSALTAVSTVPASTARRGGTPSGTTATASAGTTYAVWCGWRQKTVRPRSSVGAGLDHADVEVAVLHRSREVALLERRPHHGVLALGNAAAEDQRLGAAAHPRHQRADEHLPRARVRQVRRCGSRRTRAHAARRRGPLVTRRLPPRPAGPEPTPARRRMTGIQTYGGRVRTVHVGPLTVLPGVAGLLAALDVTVGLGVPALVAGAVLAIVAVAGARARPAPRGPGPAGAGQRRHPGPRRPGRGGHRARRAVVERRRAPRPARRAQLGRPGPRPRRRPAGPDPGHGHRAGRGVRHGDRRLPDPRAERVRRPRRGGVGAADRPGALPPAARRLLSGPGSADPSRRVRGPRSWPPSKGVVLVVAAAEVLPTGGAQVLLAVALALLVESFGRQVVTLWRHRHEQQVPRSPLVRPVARRRRGRSWSGSPSCCRSDPTS